jgi:ubiquinone/menaquinone biosynthesis C-methylase UbiE/uncharacterized protein YbaR (Trm112 family)
MKTNTIIHCRCPLCKRELSNANLINHHDLIDGVLFCKGCQTVYINREGFISFIADSDRKHFSRRMELVRKIYCRLYTVITDAMFLFCGGADKARHEVIDRLEIKPGARILETGIGTGDNIPFLLQKAEGIRLFGIDNQGCMLKQCRLNLKRWKTESRLFLANAEDLPFMDNYFDVVFHLGAINVFADRGKAIDEMIRVAKPGSKILIADETQKAVNYFEFFIGKQGKVIPPLDLIPGTMEGIRLDTIWNGFGYLIEFRKPAGIKSPGDQTGRSSKSFLSKKGEFQPASLDFRG